MDLAGSASVRPHMRGSHPLECAWRHHLPAPWPVRLQHCYSQHANVGGFAGWEQPPVPGYYTWTTGHLLSPAVWPFKGKSCWPFSARALPLSLPRAA
ncbi:hypothetical protein GDO78_018539 [Eleutherodactylus coqui]|uniref:Uncharacterized protein n=1 Tax=Eleutherodactylus coqui TaxID=57060 RepID=A0A8J6EBS2_ELECQ|nr:hypothetical protein GDO78_018539 [Eleutherodactylus coqui]